MTMTSMLDYLRRRRAAVTLYQQAASRPFWLRPRRDWTDEPDQLALAQLESFFRREERRRSAW